MSDILPEDTLQKKAIREIAQRNAEIEEALRKQHHQQQRQNALKSSFKNLWYSMQLIFGRHINRMTDKDGLELKWLLDEDEHYILLFVDSETQANRRDPLAKISLDLDANNETIYSYNDWMYHRKEQYTPRAQIACHFVADRTIEILSDKSLKDITTKE